MRFAVLADIHANRQACEACLRHAEGQAVDRYVFLGDLVGYGADPDWVVRMVRARLADPAAPALVVRGNHDEAVGRGDTAGMTGHAAAAALWHHQRLSAEDRAFLAGLPLEVEAEGVHFVHADPADPARWTYVTDAEIARASLEGGHAWLTLCGHVHAPMLYGLTATAKLAAFRPAPGVAVPLLRARRWLAVMGSVGQPRDGDPAACYAVLDTAAAECTWHRVPYDAAAAAAGIRAAGLPERLASRLLEGR
ncbi:metallophosphoesterase [Roseomonas sp. GC11]|uniref:metallophosphoesterase family protein n=1 Tax=Roseomonas sp. GC11 TaxID=2950546 RepID=UPI00210C7625|nr:metallophosphoesterase family protein [Roseomonas sp. GC11]MCQ4160363.1 metallophosphoesterase [Roseomonas sp. GC11]